MDCYTPRHDSQIAIKCLILTLKLLCHKLIFKTRQLYYGIFLTHKNNYIYVIRFIQHKL